MLACAFSTFSITSLLIITKNPLVHFFIEMDEGILVLLTSMQNSKLDDSVPQEAFLLQMFRF